MIKCLKILIYAFSLLLAQGVYGIEHVKLQLKWLHQFQFAGYYAAVQQGEIRITLVDESPTHVAIRIRDTGIGMDDETLARIFEPYAQASQQTSKEFGGTGLGLSLTKKLVELLQGQLRAESTPGTGSRFILLLPKQPKI
ncbi:MAG: ATP-binding protein [Opitutales bacterium]|jgi:signal transduction histidine kinase|nr:ATP-binding protein [Opitutales bacterium]MDP4878489.1 ATP-binding protein [Opitutales bacterium]